jgi:SH3 domain protein
MALTLSIYLWFPIVSAWPATLYVSDTTLEANLRTGADSQNRIIGLLRPGIEVTLIREEEGWAEVTLGDGRTGWILRRYLSERPPWRVTAERLAAENKQLQTRLSQIEREHQGLSRENSELKQNLDKQRQELKTIGKKYVDLEKSASNYLNLKMAYESLQNEARQSRAKLLELEKAHQKLRMSTNIRWFFSGAGVLLLGWLVGLSMGRMRRRRSSDYYRL